MTESRRNAKIAETKFAESEAEVQASEKTAKTEISAELQKIGAKTKITEKTASGTKIADDSGTKKVRYKMKIEQETADSDENLPLPHSITPSH